MTEAKRWEVEGATPEVKSLVEDVLTDDVMRGIETAAAEEAGRRMLYGADMPAPNPVSRETLAKLGRPLPAFYTPPAKRGRRSRLHDAVFRIKIK